MRELEALRNSRISFSSSLIRCVSSVVVPGRVPCSIWAFLTQVRRASGWTPSSSAILRIAPLARTGSANASNAILVARSRSSSEYFLESHDSDPSVSSLPPSNPRRFSRSPLASIFHWLVEWGLSGVVAGVVGLIMLVGCDCLPRVVSRWSGLSGGQRVLPSGAWWTGGRSRVSTEPVGPGGARGRQAEGWSRGGRPCSAGRCGGRGGR